MAHGGGDEPYRILEAVVGEVIDRIPTDRFSTKRVLDEIQLTPEGKAAYQSALAAAGEGNDHMGRMVVHGQVVPGLLRASPRVRFAGFIHGEPDESDEFHVPSWWRRV